MLGLARPESLLVPGLCLFGYWLWIDRREALVGAAVLTTLVLLCDVVGAQVKLLVERARPCWVLEGIHELAGCGGTYSFPSNHALNTAAAAAFCPGAVSLDRVGHLAPRCRDRSVASVRGRAFLQRRRGRLGHRGIAGGRGGLTTDTLARLQSRRES